MTKRKPKPLNVIVIGAGMAGLTAAAYLARAGHSVTLYEQHTEIGGVTATLSQDGFGWDVGPMLLAGFGSHERGALILKELGVADRVPLKIGDRGCVFPDFDLRKPTGEASPHWRQERLKQLFPAEHAGIDRYYRFYRRGVAFTAAQAQQQIAQEPVKTLRRAQRALAYSRVRARAGWTAQRMLDEFFVDPRLKAVFSATLANFAVPPSRFSGLGVPSLNLEHSFDHRIPPHPSFLSSLLFGGQRPSYHFILGGCGTLVAAVAARFRESGGKLYTGAAVEKIVIAGDRVKGVRLAGGHTEPADVVIATGGARETFFQLVGRQYLPAGFAYHVDTDPRMESVMMIHLGVDFDLRPYQPDPICTYYGTYDIAGSIAACRRGEYHEGHDGFVIYIPTLHSPELAPPRQHAVTICTIAPNELHTGTWQRRRRELTRTLLAQAEAVMPGLSAGIRTQHVLTPEDFRTRVHQEHHAFGGRAPMMNQEGPGHETPINGLWFIGSQSKSGGGVQNVMTGAREVVRAIHKTTQNT